LSGSIDPDFRWKIYRIEDFYSPLERAAVQERTAELAAEVAQEADRTGQKIAAEAMSTLVRRCRVTALMMRAQAGLTGPDPNSV